MITSAELWQLQRIPRFLTANVQQMRLALGIIMWCLTIIIQQVSSLFLCTIILLLFCLRLLTPQKTHAYIRLKKALVLISHKPMPGHMQTCISQTTQSALLESKYMNRFIFEFILADLIFSSFIGWLINWTDLIYQAKCWTHCLQFSNCIHLPQSIAVRNYKYPYEYLPNH